MNALPLPWLIHVSDSLISTKIELAYDARISHTYSGIAACHYVVTHMLLMHGMGHACTEFP